MRRADIEVPNRAVDVDSWARLACYPRSTFYPLSDGTSTCYRRITKACFRTCSTCLSRSQAPLLPLHSTYDFQPYSGNLCAPPLHFGRRPPQSNYPPDTVRPPAYGGALEARDTKGGISRVAPQRPKPLLHSLPPILSEGPQTPISSCSKGSRGLSVWPRVLGIFTETAISPSPSLRQRPTRYAIRAGRNLPDKEFRYLRTVIVTAAVYRGLALRLRRPKTANPSA